MRTELVRPPFVNFNLRSLASFMVNQGYTVPVELTDVIEHRAGMADLQFYVADEICVDGASNDISLL